MKVDSKDWKCKTCSDSGTPDMLQDMEELGIKGIPDELSMSSNKGDVRSSWKTLVNYAGLEYKNSCQAIDLINFETFVKASARRAWVHALLDAT